MPKQLPEQIRLKVSHIDIDYETDSDHETDSGYTCEKCGFETNSQDLFVLHKKNCARRQPSRRVSHIDRETVKKILKWTAIAIFFVVVIFIAIVASSSKTRRRY